MAKYVINFYALTKSFTCSGIGPPLKAKEIRRSLNGGRKTEKNPAMGANMTQLSTGKITLSTTDPLSQLPFPSLPPKPTNYPPERVTGSKKPPRTGAEVAADRLEKALDKATQKGRNATTLKKHSKPSQVQDVDMIDDEDIDDDDDYITEEEFVEGYDHSSSRGGHALLNFPFPSSVHKTFSFCQGSEKTP